MKNTAKYILFSSMLFLANYTTGFTQGAQIPRASPKAAISQTIGVTNIVVTYCRPSVRARRMIGNLVPYGKVWRAGANEATTISFNYPVQFGGKEVAAGKYALFMIPQSNKWTIILNKEWNQWGAYNYNPKLDVLRMEVIPQKTELIELCTYAFLNITKTEGILAMTWENSAIHIPLKTNTHAHTLADIDRAVAASQEFWYSYSAAAQYHFYEQQNAEKGLEYINVAIALNAPNPAPWMLKSQILATQGKYEAAIQMAEKAIEVSKAHNFLFEVEENEAKIKIWEKKK